jgi:hypothetical protein
VYGHAVDQAASGDVDVLDERAGLRIQDIDTDYARHPDRVGPAVERGNFRDLAGSRVTVRPEFRKGEWTFRRRSGYRQYKQHGHQDVSRHLRPHSAELAFGEQAAGPILLPRPHSPRDGAVTGT